MEDLKFEKLVEHINILCAVYSQREINKAEVGNYNEANEALIKKSVLQDLLITIDNIVKDN